MPSIWGNIINASKLRKPLPDPSSPNDSAFDVMTGKKLADDIGTRQILQGSVDNGISTAAEVGLPDYYAYDDVSYPANADWNLLNPDYRKRLELYMQYAPDIYNQWLASGEAPESWRGKKIQGFVMKEGQRSTPRQAMLYQRWKTGHGGRASPPRYGLHETGEAADVMVKYIDQSGTERIMEYPREFYPYMEDVLSSFGMKTPLGTEEDRRHHEIRRDVPWSVVEDKYLMPIKEFPTYEEAQSFYNSKQGGNQTYYLSPRGKQPYMVWNSRTKNWPDEITHRMKQFKDKENMLLRRSMIEAIGPPMGWGQQAISPPTPKPTPVGLYTTSGEKVGTYPTIDQASAAALQVPGGQRQFEIKEEGVAGLPPYTRAYRQGRHKETGQPFSLEYPLNPAGEEWLKKEMEKMKDYNWNKDSDVLE